MIKGLRFSKVIGNMASMSREYREQASAKYLVDTLRGSFGERLLVLLDTDLERILRDPIGHAVELFDNSSVRYYLTEKEISEALVSHGLCGKKTASKIIPELLQTPIKIGYLEYTMHQVKVGKKSFYGLGAENIAYRGVREDLLPNPSKRLERSV